MLCYKYIPWEYWFESVLMGRFKMSRPKEFNDPFDCIDAVKGNLPEAAIDAFVDKNFVPDDDFPTREVFKAAYMKVYLEHYRDAEAHRNRLNSLCLILCFVAKDGLSEDGDVLLWSHYANHAKGVRITFDIPENCGSYALERVQYSKHIPIYDLAEAQRIGQDPGFIKIYRDWICTKGLAWKYENEVRLIIHEPDMDAHRVVHNGVECFNMPRDWIKEVTFGCEVDSSVAGECVKCFDAVGIRSIRWLKASKKKYEYGLEYYSLNEA